MLLSVIVPSYNGVELLKQLIPVLHNELSSVQKYEIIIVDDGSADETSDFLTRQFPHIILLKNARKQGFARSMNRGIQMSSGKYILFLNNDMIPTISSINHLIQAMDRTEAFGVSPKIINQAGETLEACKVAKLKKAQLYMLDEDRSENSPTLYLCGGGALVNAAKLKELQGFSEAFEPFYYEDADLGIRAWHKGWPCLYEPDVSFIHAHSKTIGKLYSAKEIALISKRNRILLSMIYPFFWWTKPFFWLKALISFILFNQNEYYLAIRRFSKKRLNSITFRKNKIILHKLIV